MSAAISIIRLSKSFKYWQERPSSLKTIMTDFIRGRINLGTIVKFPVLTDVSIHIEKGEFVGIMGRNGAGKSTILKLIAGIYTPDSGNIMVDGCLAPLIELGAGFHGDLTGYENIFLNAAVLGFGKQAANKALDAIIEFSELADKIHMPVKNYSSGMLVRLAFSIATHLDAPILLIDEILAVGDEGFQRKCIAKVNELHKRGRTIILITHNPDQVEAHCQRCIVIDSQHIKFDGPSVQGVQIYKDLFKQNEGRV